MKTHLLPSLKITLFTLILFGVIYPLGITLVSKFVTKGNGGGATIEENGKVVGFEVIGQRFESEKYFNSRPSAVGYNAAATGGSNKGPTNPDYLAQVEERITNFLKQNPDVQRQDVTVDLVTASGGGLDPHISPAAAQIQVPRIAKVRGINEDAVKQLIQQNTKQPLFGIFGTPTVHVLRLNLALDKTK